MTRLALLTGVLSLALACTSDDAPTTTETGSETVAATDTGDGDGDACTPQGVYGDCGSSGLAACQAGDGPSQCLQDDPNAPSIGICGRPCADECDCWAAPADGTAPVTCKSLVTGDDGTCVLDCSGGQTCPSGTSCNDNLGICVFTVG